MCVIVSCNLKCLHTFSQLNAFLLTMFVCVCVCVCCVLINYKLLKIPEHLFLAECKFI